jgi:hypothetical protein
MINGAALVIIALSEASVMASHESFIQINFSSRHIRFDDFNEFESVAN